MGSIAEKLQYTYNAVDDIQLAINEMGVQTDDETPLGYYGNISSFENPSNFSSS